MWGLADHRLRVRLADRWGAAVGVSAGASEGTTAGMAAAALVASVKDASAVWAALVE